MNVRLSQRLGPQWQRQTRWSQAGTHSRSLVVGVHGKKSEKEDDETPAQNKQGEHRSNPQAISENPSLCVLEEQKKTPSFWFGWFISGMTWPKVNHFVLFHSKKGPPTNQRTSF